MNRTRPLAGGEAGALRRAPLPTLLLAVAFAAAASPLPAEPHERADAGLTGASMSASAMGDVDGDGHLDLFVAGRDPVGNRKATLYLGDGRGNFTIARSGIDGVVTGDAEFGDVDGDGHLDLLVTEEDTRKFPTATLYLGDGTGGFERADAGLVGVEASSCALGDVDGDGDLDAVITGRTAQGTRSTTVYLGDGRGGFTPASADVADVHTGSSSLGDVDGDGRPDLVVTGDALDGLAEVAPRTVLYLGDGRGGFTEAAADLPGLQHSSASLGDADGDGHLDLVLTGIDEERAREAVLLLGDGRGGFVEAETELAGVTVGSSSLGRGRGRPAGHPGHRSRRGRSHGPPLRERPVRRKPGGRAGVRRAGAGDRPVHRRTQGRPLRDPPQHRQRPHLLPRPLQPPDQLRDLRLHPPVLGLEEPGLRRLGGRPLVVLRVRPGRPPRGDRGGEGRREETHRGRVADDDPARSCASGTYSAEERKLVSLIREYRRSAGLDTVPLSRSLTEVAQAHVHDIARHGPHETDQCNLHSWSDQGGWIPCCYTPDQEDAACATRKPRELTEYEGDGYEIAAMAPTPKAVLEAWMTSPGHNALPLSRGALMEWEAMGVGMIGDYAAVWFGREPDPAGSAAVCDGGAGG